MDKQTQQLYDALASLILEAMHYRDSGTGAQFLTIAIEKAQAALEDARKGGEAQ